MTTPQRHQHPTFGGRNRYAGRTDRLEAACVPHLQQREDLGPTPGACRVCGSRLIRGTQGVYCRRYGHEQKGDAR